MMSSRNSLIWIIKLVSFSQPWHGREAAFQHTVCLFKHPPNILILYVKLAFFEEFPLSYMTSFSLFMLENPQGNIIPVLYMCVCDCKLQSNKSFEGEFTYQIPSPQSCSKVNPINYYYAPFAGVSKWEEGSENIFWGWESENSLLDSNSWKYQETFFFYLDFNLSTGSEHFIF